eukprot:COSAG06_NODE_56327_length_285_cov_0.838710_1_plen_39_part_10
MVVNMQARNATLQSIANHIPEGSLSQISHFSFARAESAL